MEVSDKEVFLNTNITAKGITSQYQCKIDGQVVKEA